MRFLNADKRPVNRKINRTRKSSCVNARGIPPVPHYHLRSVQWGRGSGEQGKGEGVKGGEG